ncbi:MAG TPA: tryptophan--tRNA ligase [Nitrospiria bacterium]
MKRKKRVLSGMQPSGKLHLGNFVGALSNWKELQETYDAYFFIADWHAVSTNYKETGQIRELSKQMLIDWLSVGLDPEKSTIFLQSKVPDHAVLHLLLSMIVPLPWLERNPTYKEQQQQLVHRDLSTYGFLGYPVLQASDILIYRADYVPVGIDQLPHLELTREIARRFNDIYKPVFLEPEALLTKTPKMLGTDGRKMSKSYNNAIYLSDSEKVLREKLKTMVTDPQRVRRTDPGNPEVCPVFSFHQTYSTLEEIKEVDQGCRTAGIGCIDCKKIVADHLAEELAPVWESRKKWEKDDKQLKEILNEGSLFASQKASETMKEVKGAMEL